MKSTIINKSEARKLYPTAADWFKRKLENDFGKGIFSGDILDRIKTLEDAYDEVDDATRAIYDRDHGHDLSDDILADIEIKLIAKALQGDWKADFSNSRQVKWYPLFIWSSGSGFVFTNSNYDYDHTNTNVSSHLCEDFRSIDPAHMAKNNFHN